jgi:hypothetical protein
MAKKADTAKVTIDFTGLLDSCSVQTSKKTESSIVVTKISGIALPGLFADYSKTLEELITQGHSWQSIKTGQQSGYWILKLLVASGDLICEVKSVIIEDISIKRGKEDIIAVSFKLKHGITGVQHELNTAVSTSIRVQLMPDPEPIELPEADEDDKEKDDGKEDSGK